MRNNIVKGQVNMPMRKKMPAVLNEDQFKAVVMNCEVVRETE